MTSPFVNIFVGIFELQLFSLFKLFNSHIQLLIKITSLEKNHLRIMQKGYVHRFSTRSRTRLRLLHVLQKRMPWRTVRSRLRGTDLRLLCSSFTTHWCTFRAHYIMISILFYTYFVHSLLLTRVKIYKNWIV